MWGVWGVWGGGVCGVSVGVCGGGGGACCGVVELHRQGLPVISATLFLTISSGTQREREQGADYGSRTVMVPSCGRGIAGAPSYASTLTPSTRAGAARPV